MLFFDNGLVPYRLFSCFLQEINRSRVKKHIGMHGIECFGMFRSHKDDTAADVLSAAVFLLEDIGFTVGFKETTVELSYKIC
jgi:hypothetical protein